MFRCTSSALYPVNSTSMPIRNKCDFTDHLACLVLYLFQLFSNSQTDMPACPPTISLCIMVCIMLLLLSIFCSATEKSSEMQTEETTVRCFRRTLIMIRSLSSLSIFLQSIHEIYPPSIYPLIHAVMHSPTHSFLSSFLHSSQSLIQSFIHSASQPV